MLEVDNLASQESANCGFQVFDVTRVSLEYDYTFSVDKNYVGNTLDSEVLIGGALAVSNQVVFDVSPTLNSDVLLKLVDILVETQTDDSNFITPIGLVVN